MRREQIDRTKIRGGRTRPESPPRAPGDPASAHATHLGARPTPPRRRAA